MSFLRYVEIYPDVLIWAFSAGALCAPAAHRNEFPAEYSWQVALQQSLLPLPQLPEFCANHTKRHKLFTANGFMASFRCIIQGVQSQTVASFHNPPTAAK
jgi:hypothetical protein